MKNLRLNVILLLAVIFGIAAAFGVFQYLNGVKAAYVEQGDFVKVAVAKQRIAPKTRMSTGMFTMQEIPSRYVNNDAVVDPADITGKLTKTSIYPGEQILKSKIRGQDDPPDELAYIIPDGYRALTVAVNEVSGLAGMIKPGDSVDVFVTFQDEVQDKEEVMTSLILQKIKVLAVDQGLDASDRREQDKENRTVTLAVTPQQAQPLVLSAEKGSVRLMMRPPADQGTVSIPSTRIKDLVR